MDPTLLQQFIERAKALGLPVQQVVDEYAGKASSAIDAMKANPLGAAKQAGYGMLAGTVGAPVDIAKMIAENYPPAKLATKLVQKVSDGKIPTVLDEKPAGTTDWFLEKFAPAPADEGEAAAQFAGTFASPSPQGIARNVGSMTSKIFAGINSKTADKAKMMRAMRLEQEGLPREEIHAQTGWFRGPDKKWRYEIDDSEATAWGFAKDDKSMKAAGAPAESMKYEIIRREGSLRYPDVLKHDKLYEAYPDLKKGFANTIPSGGDMRGQMDQFGTISVADNLRPKEVRSTFLHELQHRIQQEEGFTRGTNPFAMDRAIGQSPELAKRWNGDGYQMYKHNAGEAEARLVQTRKDLTAAERKKRPPWLDYDVKEPDLHQIRGPSDLDDSAALFLRFLEPR